MSQENDISWQVLRRIARQWAGPSAELVEVKPLAGGCINTCVALTLAGGEKAVCKISSHRVDRSFVNEGHQLQILRKLGLPVPAVFTAQTGTLDDPHSYILMEFIDGVALHEARGGCSAEQYDALHRELAGILLKLHETTGDHYMRCQLDPSPLHFADWPAFYHHVFDDICADVLGQPLLPIKCRKQIGRIHERLDRLLQNDDKPRLVHWDIWSTNVLARPDPDGNWHVAALLDPNCKYAHVEAELAYIALFHTGTRAFFETYQRARRMCDDYHRVRKPIYQLYFLLNHLHLFGAEYVKPVSQMLERLSDVA